MQLGLKILHLATRIPLALRYGLLLSTAIVVLKTIEYQLFSFRYSHDLYSGLLAIFFLLLGITFAYLLFGRRPDNYFDEQAKQQLLTVTERRILAGLSEGYSNQELAEQNNVSVNTVKSHLKNLYRKLKVSSRKEAVALAKEQSLV